MLISSRFLIAAALCCFGIGRRIESTRELAHFGGDAFDQPGLRLRRETVHAPSKRAFVLPLVCQRRIPVFQFLLLTGKAYPLIIQ